MANTNQQLSEEYADYARECDELANADEARLDEIDENSSYRDYLELRRNHARWLADNARESAEYFAG